MNEKKRAKIAPTAPAARAPPAQAPAAPSPLPPQAQAPAAVSEVAERHLEEDYHQLDQKRKRQYDEDMDELKREIDKLERITTGKMKDLNDTMYFQKVLGAHVDRAIGRRFDDFEKKIGMMTELTDAELDEFIKEEFSKSAKSAMGKANYSGHFDEKAMNLFIENTLKEIENLENESQSSSTTEAKGKAKVTPRKTQEESEEDPEIDFGYREQSSKRLPPRSWRQHDAVKKLTVHPKVFQDLF